MQFLKTSLIYACLVGFSLACVTPEPASVTLKSSSTAVIKESGFISIAGPNGIAQAEFSLNADFGKLVGEWNSKIISDVDGFLDSDSNMKLFGSMESENLLAFTDVEDYQNNKDRDPAIAIYFEGEKLSRIVHGGWQSFLSRSRDELKKIQRHAGKYTVKTDGEDLAVKYSLVLDWNQNPPRGVFFQSHVETEGRVPEEVEIADQWSFTSSAVSVEDAKCAGCKLVSISRGASDDGTPEAARFIQIEFGPDRKIRSIQAGGSAAKLAK